MWTDVMAMEKKEIAKTIAWVHSEELDCDGCKHLRYESDTNYTGCKFFLEPEDCNRKEE